MADEPYITVEDASAILRVTTRQVNRYGSGEHPRLRTRRAGKRVLYHREDVEALADEIDSAHRLAPPPAPRTDLVPAGDMLEYIRERDARLEVLQGQLVQAAAENATLRSQLQAVTEERDRIRGLLESADKRPWWRRLFG